VLNRAAWSCLALSRVLLALLLAAFVSPDAPLSSWAWARRLSANLRTACHILVVKKERPDLMRTADA
jgi:hypothetical protein